MLVNRSFLLRGAFAFTAAIVVGPAVCRAQVITTVAGAFTIAPIGDGGPATSAYVQGPSGIAFDGAGNYYFADTANNRIRKVDTTGKITTVAGSGTIAQSVLGSIGDGGPATSAGFGPANAFLQGIAVDGAGNLYISDYGNQRVRKVDTAGIITTFAGGGGPIGTGDGGPATKATLMLPTGLAVDSAGNLYIADSSAGRIRKVDTSGTITTVAGNGMIQLGTPANIGDGGPAINAPLISPCGLAFDSRGNLYFSQSGLVPGVRKVDTAGIITTVAGNGTFGFSGDNGPALNAQLFGTEGLAFDAAGNLFIADYTNKRIRKVDTSGIITTIAGDGQIGLGANGDGGLAINAALQPSGIAFDASGNLYFSDYTGNRVRKIALGASPPGLSASATALYFACNNFVVSACATQVLAISSLGPSISFTVSASTASGGNWLAPTAGTTGKTPQTFLVTAAGGLPAGTYKGTLTFTPTTPGYTTSITVAVTMVIPASVPAKPVITSIVNGASFQPGVVPNSVVTILGTNLASTTDNWNSSIAGGHLPASLDGVTVLFNDQPAYLSYISPTQINLVVPDIAPIAQSVYVNNNSASSNAVTIQASTDGPAFFAWPGSQVVATRQDYTYAVKAGTFPTLTTVAAKPGDVLILWGTGFGPTTPKILPWLVTPSDQTYATSTPATVTIDGIPATVYGAALASGYSGLYQVAIQVPNFMPDGDWPLIVTIGGAASPNGMFLTVKK